MEAISNIVSIDTPRTPRHGSGGGCRSNQPARVRSRDYAIDIAAGAYIENYTNPDGSTGYIATEALLDFDTASAIADDLASAITLEISIQNAMRDRGTKWAMPQSLPPRVVADILVRTGDFKRLIAADGTYELIMRQRAGRGIGTYVRITPDPKRIEPAIDALIRALVPMVDTKSVIEIIRIVAADLRLAEYDPASQFNDRLVFCNNGVWDYDRKTFTAYTDSAFETLYGSEVRLWKLAVDYNPNATTIPTITNPDGSIWDYDKMLDDLFAVPGVDDAGNPLINDEEKAAYIRCIAETVQFAIRGHSPGHALWLANFGSSIDGGNGKSCITTILRELLGARHVMSVPIERTGDTFALAQLPSAAAIISDETDADLSANAVERASVYKALVTGEPVNVEGKFANSYSYNGFHGVMVQGMNSVVKLATSGGNFWRRILILRFERNLVAEGIANPLIKSDYLRRREVLEGILYRACHDDIIECYSPDIIAACQAAKQAARSESSRVWACMGDFEPLIDLWAKIIKERMNATLRIPLRMLYDCYADRENGWATRNGYRMPLSYPSFVAELAGWAAASDKWKYLDKDRTVRIPSGPIRDWRNNMCSNPLLKAYYSPLWANDPDAPLMERPGVVNEKRFVLKELPSTSRGALEYVG